MDSGELNVDVPLASMESDVDEEQETSATSSSVRKTRLKAHQLGGGGEPSKARSASACRSTDKGSAAAAAMARLELEECESSNSGSLEDLVNSFDEKLTAVLQNYQEQVDKIAPVQVRSQEEIMNECQVWWTITGNFGNMMPIDWSKSTARAKHLPTLNLAKNNCRVRPGSVSGGGEDEDEDVKADLDMHSLILNSNPCENEEPVKSAEEVIKEIDDMIEGDDSDDEDEGDVTTSGGGGEAAKGTSGSTSTSGGPPPPPFASFSRSSRIVSEALAGRKLDELSVNELTQILSDVEILVKELSEELVSDLSVRDELEYEKELKNTFISLLLSIQSKRRQHTAEGGHKTRKDPRDMYKYLTTVIPYQPERGAPPIASLQVLVKILKAINEDSPAVPALLTDYILKVLCPS